MSASRNARPLSAQSGKILDQVSEISFPKHWRKLGNHQTEASGALLHVAGLHPHHLAVLEILEEKFIGRFLREQAGNEFAVGPTVFSTVARKSVSFCR